MNRIDNKSCIAIKSYCDTEEKQKVLDNCITFLKKNYAIPILLNAGHPVPDYITKKVDYLISYNNSVYAEKNGIFHWQKIDLYPGNFITYCDSFGYAELISLVENMHILNTHKFEIMHVINYDVDVQEVKELLCIENNEYWLDSGYDICFHRSRDNYAGLLLFSLKIDEGLNHIKKYEVAEWNSHRIKYEPYVAENAFYSVFTQMKYKITADNFQLRDFISTPMTPFFDIPNALKETVCSTGIYRNEIENKEILLIVLQKEKNLTYIIDEEEHECAGIFHAIELDTWPDKVLVRYEGATFELFSDAKMSKMKGKMKYEI